jgi:hypothetical protein
LKEGQFDILIEEWLARATYTLADGRCPRHSGSA